MAPRGTLRVRDGAIAVEGLGGLQRALKATGEDAHKELRTAAKGIVEDVVRPKARAGIPHKTGRHGHKGPHLGDSLKVSVTTSGASLYSNAPHAARIDVGGRGGNNSLITRADASHYMTRAVEDSQQEVTRRLDGVLDSIGQDFERTR